MRTSLLAVIFAAAAAALSVVTVAVAGDGVTRIALVPRTWWPAMAATLAAAAVALLRRRGASLAPLALLLLVLLPLVPGPLPPALLLWTGPAAALVWLGVLLAMLHSVHAPWAVLPARGTAAALLALAIHGAAAWRVAPSVPGGDEPHYLIITQSLLRDGDLRIENNHRRGDYRSYFAGDLSKPDYYRRGLDGEIYSVHAPGISAVVLPAFAVAGYRGVELFLLLVAAAAAGLAWTLGHRVTGRADAAWFGWAAVVLAPPTVLNSFTVYPDGVGGAIVLTGVWALVRVREERLSQTEAVVPWLWHGAALALLPWLHTRFALLAGGFGALVLVDLARTRNPAGKACAFLAAPTLGAIGWIAYFVQIYGTADPAVPYRGSDLGSPSYIAGGLGGLLFDQLYGLLTTAPVLVTAGAGLVALARSSGPFRALGWQLPFVVVPYLLTVTHFAMWWGGYSSPARFLVALLPALALPAAAAWAAAERRGTRAVLIGLLTATAGISAVLAGAERGRLAYVLRDSVQAPWLTWASRIADLPDAVPAFFARVARGRPGGLFFAEAAVWCVCLAAAWLAIRAAGERAWTRPRGRLAAVAGLVLAAAAMTASTLVWRLEGVSGRDEGGSPLHLLRAIGHGDPVAAVNLSELRVLSRPELLAHLRMRLPADPRAGGRADVPLVALPLVPAGVYRVAVEPPRPSGWLMAGIGRDQFALRTGLAASFDGGLEMRFPVDVRALVVKGDEDARREVAALVIEPQVLLSGGGKAAAGTARRAVRYGDVDAFFMDERTFPEPSGFWVGGARSADVVLQPDVARSSIVIEIRNAPVVNALTLRSGGWRQTLTLQAGQIARIAVPSVGGGATAVGFDVSSGFRPSEQDAASRDSRFLGVWVTIP